MERKINRQETYNTYKRKKNSILFLLIVPALLMLGLYIILYFTKAINGINLGTLYIVLIIGYLVLVFTQTPKLHYYKMQSDYMRLILNEPHLKKSRSKLFTTSWIDFLKHDGYELVQEDLRHILLCKYYKRLPDMKNSERTLVFIVIAKNNDFDFYGDEVDNGIQTYHMKNKGFDTISKQITLQFKKCDMIDKDVIKEVETAILFKASKQVITNLTFVYSDDKQSVLSLNPDKWYPNKYTYFAFTEFKRLCDIKE